MGNFLSNTVGVIETAGYAQIAIGGIALLIAFLFIKRKAKRLASLIIGSGITLITRGVIDIATVSEWGEKIWNFFF